METKAKTDREVLSVEELASFLGVGRTYAFALIKDSRVPSFKVGRLRKVRLADAREFVDRLAAKDLNVEGR